MGLEQEVSNEVYRLMELHQEFENGNYEEMNDLYSDEFQGWLYKPSLGQVEKFNLKDIKEGNEEAANHFKGKKIQFIFSGLKILPQHENQATTSYEITYSDDKNERVVRALNLEVWQKGSDDKWRIIRWYQEKGV
ncbi:protein of unknown function [Virgibacillus subterraneus]|uniref:DUF4440 domain-containing protein n=1 Tax=Virgibacillus subterraneus TaxID=621109 RepID=A0A1H9K659_9BACI|nr:DUF4440 domain-containing protein [Virgibacillus subterraneus]SEQ94423.1 protein of unknown function [Virgibacillus subterraneus]